MKFSSTTELDSQETHCLREFLSAVDGNRVFSFLLEYPNLIAWAEGKTVSLDESGNPIDIADFIQWLSSDKKILADLLILLCQTKKFCESVHYL